MSRIFRSLLPHWARALITSVKLPRLGTSKMKSPATSSIFLILVPLNLLLLANHQQLLHLGGSLCGSLPGLQGKSEWQSKEDHLAKEESHHNARDKVIHEGAPWRDLTSHKKKNLEAFTWIHSTSLYQVNLLTA